MSSTDPSVHCDCRTRIIRTIRIIALVVAVFGTILREAGFASAAMPKAVSGLVVGLAFATYGIATMCDESATLPRPLYAIIAAIGVLLAALWGSRLF